MPRPVGRPGAVRRHPAGGRARAGAHRVPRRVLLGPRRRRSTRGRGQPRSTPALVAVDGARVATGPRLRPRRPAQPRLDGVCTLDEAAAAALAAALRTPPFAVRVGRRQALHPLAGRAVHDLDAAAGGRPQAAASPRSARCGSPSGCTRTATSPTCVPTRTTLSETAISAARTQAAQLYGAEYVPDEAAPLRAARSRTRRRRTRRSARPATASAPRRGRRRAGRRRVRALRADLEAHRRLADGRRARADA